MQLAETRQSGFSLIELLVAMAIIAILAVAIVPNLYKNVDKAKITRTKQDIRTLGTALASYRLDVNHFPTTEQGLNALIQKSTVPPVPTGWDGPYLPNNKIPLDVWGQPYQYLSPGKHNKSYDLYSYGSSMKENGNTIIGNWNLDDQ